MGDFNGKIGKQRSGEENIIGEYTIGKRNNNGERLVNLSHENNLAILNTFFKKKPSKKWTWKSPDGSYHNEIDFITSNQPKAFKDVKEGEEEEQEEIEENMIVEVEYEEYESD
ncbi:craniofacial development protein 2-like [Pieris napi]|uniref:craniofacial development protein 2-like n=1 Tax=Pieris napi TaxID=78633 RepID=UPI001FB99C9E|nr:craniofacial development protein 2-like [Pieris napi]